MKRAVLYNMFRNGDLFLTREFAKSLIAQLPTFQWYYAHGNHSDSLKDLPATYLPMAHHWEVCASNHCQKHEVSELLPKYKPLHEYETVRYLSQLSPMYINTWPGCFYNIHFDHNTYPNMHEYLNIWRDLGKKISNHVQQEIIFNDDVINYFPTLNESSFDQHLVQQFHNDLWNAGYKKRILFANGKSMSGQSQLQSMDNAIIKLARQYPKIAMVVTSEIINAKLPQNIFYTSDFFIKPFDLPEIAMFSSYCDIIVGKNSGPYTFAHTKKNIMDKNKTFVSFSNLARDNTLYNIESLCSFSHSDTSDENNAHALLLQIIQNNL